jgi:hypothetical protein
MGAGFGPLTWPINSASPLLPIEQPLLVDLAGKCPTAQYQHRDCRRPHLCFQIRPRLRDLLVRRFLNTVEQAFYLSLRAACQELVLFNLFTHA